MQEKWEQPKHPPIWGFILRSNKFEKVYILFPFSEHHTLFNILTALRGTDGKENLFKRIESKISQAYVSINSFFHRCDRTNTETFGRSMKYNCYLCFCIFSDVLHYMCMPL